MPRYIHSRPLPRIRGVPSQPVYTPPEYPRTPVKRKKPAKRSWYTKRKKPTKSKPAARADDVIDLTLDDDEAFPAECFNFLGLPAELVSTPGTSYQQDRAC